MGTAKRMVIVGYRLAAAAVAATAITVQFHKTIGQGGSPVNFFSFFTIQSNLFAVVVFAIGATLLLTHTTWQRFAYIRGAAAMYMLMTGIIFALLLSGKQEAVQTTIPWVDTMLHRVFPIILGVDWLVDAPRQRLSYRWALVWLIYPLLYFAYSLIRGAAVHWYPYPFLNPAHGVVKLVVTSVIICVACLGLVWLLTIRSAWLHTGQGRGVVRTPRQKSNT